MIDPPTPPTPPDPPDPPAPPASPDAPDPSPRKDRLVQTRVPRELESRLKAEAGRRRVTVSHFVRSVLEEAVDLVDDVLETVDDLVADSVELAENVSRDAIRAARDGLREARPGREAPGDGSAAARVADVVAWNPVILNRAATCAVCDRSLARGEDGFAGLADGPTVWLCPTCIEEVR